MAKWVVTEVMGRRTATLVSDDGAVLASNDGSVPAPTPAERGFKPAPWKDTKDLTAAIEAGTRCPRCGGIAYHGLLETQCFAPVCPPPEVVPEIHEGTLDPSTGMFLPASGVATCRRGEPAFYVHLRPGEPMWEENGILGATRDAVLDAWRKRGAR